jgi:hypothetical protein
MISDLRKTKIHEIKRTIQKISNLLEKTQKLSSKIGWIRFYTFFAGLVIFLLLFFLSFKTESIFALILFSILFVIISSKQNSVLKLIKKYKVWADIKQKHLARVTLNWDTIPPGKVFVNSETSPLEMDLDLTGDRSLHRLIDLSKSAGGSLELRKYFTEHNIDRDEIRKRQSIVKELVSLSHFREKFLLESYLSTKKEIESNSLIEWLEKSNKTNILKKQLRILYALCFVNLLFIGLAILNIVSGIWGITTLVYISYYLFNYKSINTLSVETDILNDELKKVIRVFSFVENYNFGRNKNLESLCAPLRDKSVSPTIELKKINNIVTALSFKQNPFVWSLAAILFPLDYFFAYRLEIYKTQIDKYLPQWLEVRNKLEAFVSIANFSCLNSEYVFPEIKSGDKDNLEISLTMEEIGHPLIPHEYKKRNSYETNKLGGISIITGSNMSGKSTFLRTIGINLCLAYAGAPVDAKYFSTGMMRLFTCIKVSDSVVDGISYFYAEVKRLKKLVEEINSNEKYPLFFLIDEIFKGTNNVERLKGSRAMIKLLANKSGAGIISTHDLELVNLAEEISSISNCHFREEIVDGKMAFDYTLRKGPCPSTNAIEIMRLNGLPIE